MTTADSSERNRKGFTYIELLLVVAIISVIAAAVLLGLGPLQRRGRDTRRFSDLRQMRGILELYAGRYGCYPTASGSCGSGGAGTIPWGTPPFAAGTLGNMLSVGPGAVASTIPVDPNPGSPYVYAHNDIGNRYVIGAMLDDPANPALEGDYDGSNVFGTGVDCGTGVPPNEVPPRYCLEI